MNFYQARELKDENDNGTGIWHYTCYNDNQKTTYPIGYCAKWEKPILIEDGGTWTKKEAERYITNKDKYHNKKGHTSSEEAGECYRNHLLDKIKFYRKSLEESDTHHKCRVEGCNKMTASMANLDSYHIYNLCEKHLNREEVDKLLPKAHESFGS